MGVGDLAEEAATLLDGVPRAGAQPLVPDGITFGRTEWPNADGGEPGEALMYVEGETWTVLDYREELEMTTELATLLGVAEPQPERRQCLLRSVAAALLGSEAVPSRHSPPAVRAPRSGADPPVQPGAPSLLTGGKRPSGGRREGQQLGDNQSKPRPEDVTELAQEIRLEMAVAATAAAAALGGGGRPRHSHGE